MSLSPCYSPVLDNINQQCTNVIEGSDPVLNPFYYAQDRESWYAEVAAKACEEQKEKEMKKMKKKRKSFTNTSFIIRKVRKPVLRIIKISIHDVDCRPLEEIDSDPDSARVNIQYLVRNDIDEIMSETEYLVTKIVKKLSSS